MSQGNVATCLIKMCCDV